MTTLSSPAQLAPPEPTRPRRSPRLTGYALSLATILLLSLLAAVWGDAHNGYRDSYYQAAVLSATKSWKAFFFGSLDSQSFITVDKPPLAFWLQALSARTFGVNYGTVLFPQALAAVAAVGVLARTVRLAFGKAAAVVAALVLALTPALVVVAHTNHPDMVLVLLLVLAAWGCTAAIRTGRMLPLVLAAVALGLGFNTKLLAAFIPLPALALAYLVAADRPLRSRIWRLTGAGGVLLGVSGAWMAIVQLIPAGSRPYIGSTSDNSELDLVFNYNGLGRIFGVSKPPPTPAGTGFLGTRPGLGRLFEADVAGQISWLLPLAVVALAAGLWLTRRAPRIDQARAGYLLWGGWLLVQFVVLSFAKGQWHAYYTVAMAPAIAALVGAGVATLVRQAGVGAAWWLGGGLAATTVWGMVLLHRTPQYEPWLPWAVGAAALVALAGLAYASGRGPSAGRLGLIAAGIGLVAALAGPTAYVITTDDQRYPLGLVQAGPLVASVLPPDILKALPTVSKQQQAPDSGLLAYLAANRGNARWLAAAPNAIAADQYIIATGQPVLAMGGYLGTDPPPTVDQLQALTRSGSVRFVLLPNLAAYGQQGGSQGKQGGSQGQRGAGSAATPRAYPPGPAGARDTWVRTYCAPVSPGTYGGTATAQQSLYDCVAAG